MNHNRKVNIMQHITDWIELIDNWLSDPTDEVQLEQWRDAADTIADSFCFSDNEQLYIDYILDCYEEQHRLKMSLVTRNAIPIAYLDEVLARKQLEQRTPEWYEQMATVLSASELGSLFASVRQRAKLVVSKTVPYPARNQSLAVSSERMSAFDWGIRFEPVVKQIYEHKYGATLKELGRMHHQTDPRCTASPDGLVYHCPGERMGRLIEIKCPVTREIDGTVPKDYYSQMQMQLHVTGLRECDYIEAVFSSIYNQIEVKQGPALYDGFIAVVRYEEPKGCQEFYYVYSPLHAREWTPTIQEGEEIIEITPWRLYQWGEQVVTRNEEWWSALQPVMEAFWMDVDKAKRGEFTVPDSSRVKSEPCRIQFHKLDENGMPL